MSRIAAVKHHDVPVFILMDRFNGYVVHVMSPGARPYLSKNEERELSDFLVECVKIRHGKKQEGTLNVLRSPTFKKNKWNLMISILGIGGRRTFTREILNLVFEHEMR